MSRCVNANLVGKLSVGKGDRGKSIEYMWRGTELGIRVEGEEEYQFVDLRPSDEVINGREVELQVDSGYIQWRYAGEYTWKNLIAISDLKGDKGEQGVSGKDGVDGANGENGKSIEFKWNGTELGIRQEGQEDYEYVDLRGQKGNTGATGNDGTDGKSIEFNWNGTQLGVRKEGQLEYSYVDLKGNTGATGKDGATPNIRIGNVVSVESGEPPSVTIRGDKENPILDFNIPKGVQGIQGTNGKDGTNGENGKSLQYNWNGTELGVKREDENSYSYVDLKGRDGQDGKQGEKGDKSVYVGELATAPPEADVIFDNSDIDVITEGVTPNITIGEVITVDPNEKAEVTRKGTNKNPIFDFKIPRGEKGKDGAGGSGTGEKIILNYIHNSNKVIQPISLDFSTGVFTCAEAHELKNGDKLLLDFTPVKGEYFNQTKILKELFDFRWTTWYFMVVEVVTDVKFKIKNNANNTYLTYKESNTPNLDFNAFRFQLANQIVLSNLGLSKYRKLKFKLNLLTIGQEYCNSINVLKLSNENHPLKQTGIKFKGWYSPASLLYPNISMDINSNAVYGHSAKFRNDLIENVITIQEDKVLRSAKMTSIGYTDTFTAHENNVIARSYTFDNVFEDVGYEDGNVFLDTITIPQPLKILNGSVIEIYSLEG